MGALLEVLAVEVDETIVESSLLGANIDSPAADRRMAASGLEIGGWALAPSGRPEAIEVSLAGEVLARGTWQHRDDLAAAFPEQTDATGAGFEIVVDASKVPAEAELEVGARVDGSSIAFARLRLRRYWRGELDPDHPPLVSIAVVDERAGAAALDRTLSGIAMQRHPATEVLVLRPPTSVPSSLPGWEENGVRGVSAGVNGPDLRNEGIRQSNGDLILFLPAGATLAPDALALGVEMLTRQPAAIAVIDGDRDGVAAALYRRSGFEELTGFADSGNDCDLELAIRAQQFGALFAPGALIAAGG